MDISFTVPGRPVPAARMTQRGKYVKTQAQRYLAYKEAVGWAARLAMRGKEMLKGDVSVEIWVFSTGKRIGDIDNIGKSILDGMNKIVYLDDNQVIDFEIHSRKEMPERAEIVVKQV